MKKHIVAIALIAGLTMATAASANWGRGGRGGDYGNCPQMQGAMVHQLDPAAQEKVTTFFKDNQVLHKQLAMKQAEKHAIMRSEKPDPQAAAKIAGELFDLRTAMHDKAEAAGVSQYLGPMGGCKGGRGPGSGFGGRPGMMGQNGPQQ
jgi:hypothetical protein